METIFTPVKHYDKRLFRYMNRFFGLKCAPDLLLTKVFPNAKEITESSGAFWAYMEHLKDDFPLDDEDIHIVCVGDGVTPRTATMFAFRTKFNCVSIDPALRTNAYGVDRLHCISKRVEEVDLHYPKVIIVAVHSHAKMDATLDHITGDKRAMIAIPCCVKYDDIEPDVMYNDVGIWSTKNTIKIWKSI